MRTLQIAVWGVAALLLVGACNVGPETVAKVEYDQLMQEYEDLKASAESTRSEYAAQSVAIDNILQQLAQISGRTVVLRSDLESGTVQLTQVQQIEDSIEDIKGKLRQLDALSAKNAELRKMVLSLKKVIEEKEVEIAELKAEIRAKDLTINLQQDTINTQSSTIRNQIATISAQQEDIRAALQEQARMLFQAGQDFEQLGDNAPEVSRRKDKAKVQAFADEMYEKALFYYKQAAESGYPQAAGRMAEVEEKRSR